MENNMHDDQFDFNPSQYQDQGAAILPDPGEYVVRATSVSRKKDRKTSEPVMQDGKYPVLTLNRIEIVEPEDDNAQYAVFADVPSKPFGRAISKTQKVGASKALDLVRAIDVNLTTEVEGFDHAIDVAEAALNAGQTFRAKLGYKVVDMDQVKLELAQIDENDKEEARKVWNRNTYYTKAFKRQDGKGYNATITTPQNKTLTAKLVIDSFVPSNKPGNLGAF